MVRSATRALMLLGLAAMPLTACVAEYPTYSQPAYVAPYYGPYYAAPAPVYRPYSYYSFNYRSGPSPYYDHRYHRHHRDYDGRDWR